MTHGAGRAQRGGKNGLSIYWSLCVKDHINIFQINLISKRIILQLFDSRVNSVLIIQSKSRSSRWKWNRLRNNGQLCPLNSFSALNLFSIDKKQFHFGVCCRGNCAAAELLWREDWGQKGSIYHSEWNTKRSVTAGKHKCFLCYCSGTTGVCLCVWVCSGGGTSSVWTWQGPHKVSSFLPQDWCSFFCL